MEFVAYIYIDEKGPQENFKISNPFSWKEKLAYGAEPMHGYVANVLYVPENNIEEFNIDYKKIEEEYLNTRQNSLKELKGSKLLERKFKYGIASMKPREVNFYTKLMKLILKCNVENLLFSINKMSILVNAKLLDWIYTVDEKRLYSNPYLLKYILTKFFDVEASESTINCLLDKDKTSKELLSIVEKEMNSIIETQKNNRRMASQIEEYKKIVKLIKQSKHFANNIYEETNFDWNKVRFALDLWLSERRVVLKEDVGSIQCYLDQNIPKNCFDELGFQNVIDNCDSSNIVGIRATDCLVAFAGTYIKKLREDSVYNPNEAEVPKRLSLEWFNLNEDKFELLKLMDTFFFARSQYSFVVDTYFDCEELFRAFLDYIASYNSYQEFCKINSEKHSENVFKLCFDYAIERWEMSKELVVYIRKEFGSYRAAVNTGLMRPL